MQRTSLPKQGAPESKYSTNKYALWYLDNGVEYHDHFHDNIIRALITGVLIVLFRRWMLTPVSTDR